MYSCSLRACDGRQRLRPRLSHELRGVREILAGADEGDDGRTKGRNETFVAGDLNVELGGVLCMDEVDEMKEIYGLQCWYGTEAGPRGFKKAMWMEIMKEFSCKVLSSWLSRDDWREKTFTHKA